MSKIALCFIVVILGLCFPMAGLYNVSDRPPEFVESDSVLPPGRSQEWAPLPVAEDPPVRMPGSQTEQDINIGADPKKLHQGVCGS
ncbi:MAG: hypothetical protein WA996_24860 [Candidatus Promineifilaceae bacterium]